MHHHVNGVVIAEEIGHAHDIGVLDLGERRRLLEKALDADAKGRGGFTGERLDGGAVAARGLVRRHVLLDDHALVAAGVDREIDDTETTDTEHLGEAVVVQQVTFRQCDLGLHSAVPTAHRRVGGKTCIMG